MAGYGINTSEEELLLTLEGAPDSFVVTHTDWYEWIENMEKEFCTRLAAEIVADATISGYCTAVPIVANEELARFDIGVYLANSPATFVIHTPTQHIDKETGGHGRDNVVLQCIVAAVVKKPGFDTTSHYEKAVMGSGEPGTNPGILEMHEHFEALIFNDGQLNRLESGGVPYVWNIGWEEPTIDEELEEKVSGILAYRRLVWGWRWRYWNP